MTPASRESEMRRCERPLRRVDVAWQPGLGEHHGGGHRHLRLGIAEVTPQQRRGILVRELRERTQRRGAYADVRVVHQSLDRRPPAERNVRAHRAERTQHPGAHPR